MESTFTRSALTVLVAAAAIGALTTASAAPRADRAANISELVQNRTFGTLSMVEGEFRVQSRSSDPVVMARDFLRAQRSRIAISDPDSELQVIKVTGPDELGMTHVKFGQHARGIPVFASELIVHIHGDVVTGMNGSYLPSIRENLRVRVPGDTAAELAFDEMRDLLNTGNANINLADRDSYLDLDSNPELVFFNVGLLKGTRSASVPAWKISINHYVLFISAESGRLLDSWDTLHSALKREIYDAKHTTNTPGQLACSGSTCASTDPDTRGAWDQFGATYDYFMNVHGRDSYDDRGGKLVGTVHYSNNYQNAYWNGSQMVFGDGMVALDVTAHELGHGVCQETANLVYKYQPGALNESLSDVWGVMVDREDWELGEDLQGIGVIRDMSDPEAYGQPKDMSGYRRFLFYDNGGVHINSGIPNYACYLASDGGTNMGVVVLGAGREPVEKSWYRAEVTRLTSSARFSDFARAVNQSCGELYGANSDNCDQIAKAFEAVGL